MRFSGTACLQVEIFIFRKEWRCYGEILRRVDEAKQWAIGDWLVDGKRHYGDGLYKEASGILEVEQQTLRRQKALSELLPMLLRSNKLSWWHHMEVSSLKLIKEDKKWWWNCGYGLFQPVVQQTVALPVKEHKATKAKAKASKTNAGAVARGDKLANDRPDLAKIDIIVMGQMSHVIHGRSIAGT
jgi:hypothetical protein